MVLNFVSAIASFVTGSWLIYTSQTYYSSTEKFPRYPPKGLDSINFVQLMLLLVGTVAILIGFVFTLNGYDILTLLLKDGKKKSCNDSHRQTVKKEMRNALGEGIQN